jgi:hypothetical protein
LPPPRQPEVVEAMKATTPSRIITGRTGTRYLTESYLGLRADHAIAIDAVESELDEAWGRGSRVGCRCGPGPKITRSFCSTPIRAGAWTTRLE